MTAPNPLIDTEALRLAAPGPAETPDDIDPELDAQQQDLDAMCERWVAWTRSRRLYAPQPDMGSVLGQLSGKSRPVHPGGPDALNSPELAAFHIAYLVQPEALDKAVFNAYYVRRTKPIKQSAAVLGISDRHFYRLLGEFRVRVYTSSKVILRGNEAARDALPHGPGASKAEGQ